PPLEDVLHARAETFALQVARVGDLHALRRDVTPGARSAQALSQFDEAIGDGVADPGAAEARGARGGPEEGQEVGRVAEPVVGERDDRRVAEARRPEAALGAERRGGAELERSERDRGVSDPQAR